jgi:hypothetical protein
MQSLNLEGGGEGRLKKRGRVGFLLVKKLV